MGFFDLFKSTVKSSDIIHLKNMILVASADSVIQESELALITSIMQRMNISATRFNSALQELVSENKIRISGGKIFHTGNVLLDIEVVHVTSLGDKLKYLQDYVLIMMGDGSIDKREKELCSAIALKMGLPASYVDIVVQMVAKKIGGYGTKSADSSSDGPNVSNKAINLYRSVQSKARYISSEFRELSTKGIDEAKILCTSLLLEFRGGIDEDTQHEVLALLLNDIERHLYGDEDDMIDFLNDRFNLYHDEISSFRQPNYSCMRIYNALYCKPLESDIDDFSDCGSNIMDFLLLYSVIVQVANDLK